MTAIAPLGKGSARLRVGACLSLSGAYARFGRQAALGLDIWRSLDGDVDLTIEDDRSDPRVLAAAIPRVSEECDVLLGPYSTYLMRTAGDAAAELDRVIWNHGGSGDDVEAAHPGHIVSLPTPASRYAQPFLRLLRNDPEPAGLWIVQGRGGFGRQVAAGAETTARTLGIGTVRLGPGQQTPAARSPSSWNLLCAGTFEEDVETVAHVLNSPNPPRRVCAVAAGVREFGHVVEDAQGVFGVGQWFPGSGPAARIGPVEGDFLTAYLERAGTLPDYPAVQAVAAAALAAHCVRLSGGTSRELLWSAASALEVATLFGAFKIDPYTGTQIGHTATLVRWTRHGPVAVPPPLSAR
jgi:ABC-type branched-subunit amino acid transport system substrate-binding protein